MVTKWSWRRIYAKCSVRARKTTPSAKPGKTGRHFAKNGERITGASKGWGRIFPTNITDTVPKSVSVPVKKEHSLKTLLVLQITITNNKIQRLCYYQRNSFLP